MYGHKYTQEQIDYLAENITGREYTELATMFNQRFGLQLGVEQIKKAAQRRKLCNGRDTRFKPGLAPHNKGKKCGGWEPTQFRDGQMPWNYRPVGSERVNRDGYLEIKTADPKKWRSKHVIVWEEANGPVPKGYGVIFGDGDKSNFELSNLILVSRRELLVLNQHGLIGKSAELTKTGIAIAEIYIKLAELRKQKK